MDYGHSKPNNGLPHPLLEAQNRYFEVLLRGATRSHEVLTWKQTSDGWHADGYHIELVAPFRWVLTEEPTEAEPDGPVRYVATMAEPIAIARTLSEAKREAELHDMARYRAQIRCRHAVTLLLVISISFVAFGSSPLQNITVVLLALYMSMRSIGVIAGTFLWRLNGNSKAINFYQ